MYVIGEDGLIYDGAMNPWRYHVGGAIIEIFLPNRGVFVLIDAYRHAEVSQHYWYKDSRDYTVTKIGGKKIYMHTVLFP
jgi:hypothetical protein